jgi:hypothetical protein
MVHSTNILTYGLSTNDKKRRFSEAHSFHNSENYEYQQRDINLYKFFESPNVLFLVIIDSPFCVTANDWSNVTRRHSDTFPKVPILAQEDVPRKNQKCVQVSESSWFVWNFEVEQPYFRKDADYMAQKLPVFAIVYKVKVKLQANQHVLKCDCLHYERCGIPFTHIMKITDEIDETMITVPQHQKVYSIHFGLPNSRLSDQLMKALLMQILHEDLGMPITVKRPQKEIQLINVL